jgi:hypothetical protein
MAELRLHGRITEDGKLEVELPEGVVPGEVEVTLTPAAESLPWELRPWTEDELREMLTFTPKTGKEIVEEGLVGGWEDLGIEDSVQWVEEQRRKLQEKNRW